MPTTKAQVELPRFLAGGLIAAVIAAIAGVVTRGVVNALLEQDTQLRGGDLLVPTSLGGDQYELLSVGQTVLVSVVLGIAATIVLYLFIVAVPRPLMMFNTLGVLFLIASLLPILTFDDPPVALSMQLGLAAVHVVVGLTILGLLGGVVRSTVRMVRVPDAHDPHQPQGYPPQQPSYPQQQQPPAGYQQQQGWPQQPQ
jgi:hypothetical protein